jgi:hypothetical protein
MFQKNGDIYEMIEVATIELEIMQDIFQDGCRLNLDIKVPLAISGLISTGVGIVGSPGAGA